MRFHHETQVIHHDSPIHKLISMGFSETDGIQPDISGDNDITMLTQK